MANNLYNFLQSLFTFVTIIIMVVTFIKSLKMTKVNKIIDVTINCQKRFDTIVWESVRLINEGKVEVEEYYERYWNLQLEQFQYWKLGFINDEIYKYWMSARFKEWNQNKSIGEISYQDGWHKAAEYYCCLRKVAPGRLLCLLNRNSRSGLHSPTVPPEYDWALHRQSHNTHYHCPRDED